MKLIHYLILRITLIFTVIMLLWSGVYLYLQMQEINDGNDEGLINLKQEFVIKANTTPGFVEKMEENMPLNMMVKEISREEASQTVEHFETTEVYFVTEEEEEEERMLTSAFYCELNGKYYQIQFFTSTVETDDMIENILFLTMGLWLVLIITLVVVSRIIITQVNKPFYKLLDELKKFRLDNSKSIVLPKTEVREYSELNEAVDELIHKNIDIFTEQKEFIENSSHELQTPLAIAIAKLELMTEKYQQNETQMQELNELSSVLNRMKRLNASLLLLSKIRNHQFTNLQSVNLNEVLTQSLEELADFIDYKEIKVNLDSQAVIWQEMNADLAQILLVNLLKNAITHNEQGGNIDIEISQNKIIISNSGTSEIQHIFSRYNSGQTSGNSSGLGLAIVKSIADLYKINIEYAFENSKHSFVLRF
jgi:signal transduction histidine kinase